MYKTLEFLSKNPVPSTLVSKRMPKILANVPEYGIPSQRMMPNFLGTRNLGIWCGKMPQWNKLEQHVVEKASAIHISHGDKITLVPVDDQETLIADCQIRGLEVRKPACLIDSNGIKFSLWIEEKEGKLCYKPRKDVQPTLSLNPTHRIVFEEPLVKEGNLVHGSGLDNDCGIAITLHLIRTLISEKVPVLVVITDSEEGPAKNGRFSTGARELNIALRQAGFNGTKHPVVILDGVDAESKEAIDDEGQVSIAWQISDGTRGVISAPMAKMIQPFVNDKKAYWYRGYSSGSCDWNLDFLLWFRIGVRGNGWHSQDKDAPYANYNDLYKIYDFLSDFYKSLY